MILLLSSKNWAVSSAGRAPALHAGGQRFDPATVHHDKRLRFLTGIFFLYKKWLCKITCGKTNKGQ